MWLRLLLSDFDALEGRRLRLGRKRLLDGGEPRVRLAHVHGRRDLDLLDHVGRTGLSGDDGSVGGDDGGIDRYDAIDVAVAVVRHRGHPVDDLTHLVDALGGRDQDVPTTLGVARGLRRGDGGGLGVDGGTVELGLDASQLLGRIDRDHRIGHRPPHAHEQGDDERETEQSGEGPEDPAEPAETLGLLLVVAVVGAGGGSRGVAADDDVDGDFDALLREGQGTIDAGSHEKNLRNKKRDDEHRTPCKE